MSLFLRALTIAYTTDRAAIDMDVMELAFIAEIWRGGVAALNPFSTKFHARRLDRRGEPFSDVFRHVQRRAVTAGADL